MNAPHNLSRDRLYFPDGSGWSLVPPQQTTVSAANRQDIKGNRIIVYTVLIFHEADVLDFNGGTGMAPSEVEDDHQMVAACGL